MLSITHLLAVQELLTAKAVLDTYAPAGLTDLPTLRQALAEAAEGLDLSGSAKGVLHQAKVRGDFAVAYVIAEEKEVIASLHRPADLARVKGAYRDVMHWQAHALMKRSQWQEAILLWRHLHERKLVSSGLYLDAAVCLKEMKKPQDALTILEEAYTAFAPSAAADWLERCGDLALLLGPAGESLAQKAYEKASERLRNTQTERGPSPEWGHRAAPWHPHRAGGVRTGNRGTVSDIAREIHDANDRLHVHPVLVPGGHGRLRPGHCR